MGVEAEPRALERGASAYETSPRRQNVPATPTVALAPPSRSGATPNVGSSFVLDATGGGSSGDASAGLSSVSLSLARKIASMAEAATAPTARPTSDPTSIASSCPKAGARACPRSQPSAPAADPAVLAVPLTVHVPWFAGGGVYAAAPIPAPMTAPPSPRPARIGQVGEALQDVPVGEVDDGRSWSP